jgi:hypothetical protein
VTQRSAPATIDKADAQKSKNAAFIDIGTTSVRLFLAGITGDKS